MKIGVMLFPIPIAPAEETEHALGYAETRELALQAEATGFDSIWVFDHLLLRYPGQPTEGVWEGWTVLAALAEATRRVELGTLVSCVPFRAPALLAKMADTLEEVSGGRLILGLGAGWHQLEFDAFGIPFDHKVDRFEEAGADHLICSLSPTSAESLAHLSAALAVYRQTASPAGSFEST